MKRKVLIGAVLAIALSLVAGGTLAYFTAESEAHNVITSGKVDITIVETQMSDEGLEVEFPKEGISGVMPGGEVSKIVTVKAKEDSAQSWVRVWVNVGISEPGDPILNPTIKNLPLTITNASGEEIDVVTMEFNLGTAEGQWTKGEDYYYYYNSPIDSGEVTEPLFKDVKFAPEMGNEYQNCNVIIDIYAEAIQTANNLIPEGGDITDVWPDIDYELGYDPDAD